ncbi:MAG: hypothetical protein AB2651_05000 [Candidatus Thiodiazotropha sp.]
MTQKFLKQMNEYVIDAILATTDEEVLASIGRDGYPSQVAITRARKTITQALKEQRKHRLSQQRAAFQAHQQTQHIARSKAPQPSMSDMLSDIVAALQNKGNVPEGILLAFRAQSQGGSEEDIVEIWQTLVELGLISPNDTKNP